MAVTWIQSCEGFYYWKATLFFQRSKFDCKGCSQPRLSFNCWDYTTVQDILPKKETIRLLLHFPLHDFQAYFTLNEWTKIHEYGIYRFCVIFASLYINEIHGDGDKSAVSVKNKQWFYT